MEDVYVVTMIGGYVGPVTICDPSIARNTIRQLRNSGRKIKVFRNSREYLNFLERNYEERRKNIMLQQMEIRGG